MQQFQEITQNNPKTTTNIAAIYELNKTYPMFIGVAF